VVKTTLPTWKRVLPTRRKQFKTNQLLLKYCINKTVAITIDVNLTSHDITFNITQMATNLKYDQTQLSKQIPKINYELVCNDILVVVVL